MAWRSTLEAAVGMALLVLTSTAASGQSLTGRLLDADTDEPVSGAMLVATDAAGDELGRTLTDDDGRFVLGLGRTAVPRSLRLVRIGYASQNFAVAGLPTGEPLVLRAASMPIELEGFGVVAEALCGDDFERIEQVYDVWLEVRKALELTRYTEGEPTLGFATERIVRVLGADDLEEVVREVLPRELLGETPYRSLTVEQMTERGWVVDDGDGVVYFAPDVEALLANEFAAQHCWGAEFTEDRILLRFTPNRSRAEFPEIEGELVLNRESYELDHLRFTYTSVPIPQSARGYASGEVHFTAAPNGFWIVREWWIRTPIVTSRLRRRAGGFGQETVVAFLREERGRVLRIHTSDEVLDLTTRDGRGP